MVIRNIIYSLSFVVCLFTIYLVVGVPGDKKSPEEQWREIARKKCNPVEIGVLMKRTSAPDSVLGQSYKAACYTLAGNIEEARKVIDSLPQKDRTEASSMVFRLIHYISDSGDEISARPAMKMTIDYQPEHYMALYHAGMAEYELATQGAKDASLSQSEEYLSRFLKIFKKEEIHRKKAIEVLAKIRNSSSTDIEIEG